MVNSVMLVGRFVKLENDTIVLSIPSNSKNENGEWYAYNISCSISGSLLENTKKYVSVGNIVGIRGHFEDNNMVVVEKITFLSGGKEYNNE